MMMSANAKKRLGHQAQRDLKDMKRFLGDVEEKPQQKTNYAGYECGDFLDELDRIIALSLSLGSGRVNISSLIQDLNSVMAAVKKSKMADGHGQKGCIYEKAVEIYQKIIQLMEQHQSAAKKGS